ncbi:MAG: hypothetical protein M0R80_30535 [Proteobacteria bacterium]|nr:hypothetical protein [Pseudomonadota bacterium]
METENRWPLNSWTRFGHYAQIVRNKKKAFRAIHAKGFRFSAGDARFERATFGSGGRENQNWQAGAIIIFS